MHYIYCQPMEVGSDALSTSFNLRSPTYSIKLCVKHVLTYIVRLSSLISIINNHLDFIEIQMILSMGM